MWLLAQDPSDLFKYGVGGVVGSVLLAFGGYVYNYILKRQTIGVANDKVAIREYGKIVARQELRIASLEEKVERQEKESDAAKRREAKCWRKFDRVKACMENYEDAMRAAKIPFRPVDLTDLDSRDFEEAAVAETERKGDR